ncbi:MAG: hypothetical protein ABS81_05085 [Pseudonocardia sp. SCN 72-86]|nr:MAG: hypothetical protein ABS81_05085 [Pseudonocardia sp. SCN 72-86]
MAEFGHFEFSPMDSMLDGSYVWQHLQAPYLEAKNSDEEKFIIDIAAVAVQAGGWAAYGAHRTVASLVGPGTDHPDYIRTVMTALYFLRDEGYGSDRLNDFEQAIWWQVEGDAFPRSR